MYKYLTLKNGARVVIADMPQRESIAVGIWVQAGSCNETEKSAGISHFLEHMAFKGTRRRTAREIKKEIEGRGGSLNGFTSEELTCYLAKVSKSDVKKAMDVLMDMVWGARLEKRDIEKERNVILEEIKMYKDLPGHYVHDILSEIMWPRHPLRLPVAGTPESVRSITRRDLIRYRDRNYRPSNIIIVVCGDIKDTASIADEIEAMMPGKSKTMPPHIMPRPYLKKRPSIKLVRRGVHQTHIAMGFYGPHRRHIERHRLSLLHIILGANMSSRLFETIRERKGLAYEINTEIKRYMRAGAFIINAGIEQGKLKDAVRLIVRELSRIKNRYVGAAELKRAKEFFRVQFGMNTENTLEHMVWLGEEFFSQQGLPDRNRIIEDVESSTREDLRRLARNIFQNKSLNLAIVSPDGGEVEYQLNNTIKEL